MSESDLTQLPQPAATEPQPRFAVVDLVRGLAIGAMVVYHTAFDLSDDRLIGTDIVDNLGWRLFARSVAGTFLLVVGVSLVLATRNGFRLAPFLRRVGLIAGGAVLVSLATWWFDPSTFVFFGILHEIAVASVLAIPFLWLPGWLVALAAVAVLAAPWFLANPLFDWWPLLWIGLSPDPPATVDYVPVLPWFGVVLAGLILGRLAVRFGDRAAAWHPSGRLAAAIAIAGRRSLPIYLIHQPLIVGALALVVIVLPPGRAVVEQNFLGQCSAACANQGRSATDCTQLCACMFDGLYGTDLFAMKSFDAMTPDQTERWDGVVNRCLAPPQP